MNANEQRHLPPSPAWTLERVLAELLHPDPATVSLVDKGNGTRLPYVGHAEITRLLCTVDPTWTWAPLEVRDGRPVTTRHRGTIPRRDREPIEVEMVTLWGQLTILGTTRLAVGSVEAHKPDLDKELVGDLLRNGAMRFGIGLGLWLKEDPAPATPGHGAPAQMSPDAIGRPQTGVAPRGHNMATEKQERAIYAISKALGILPPPRGAMTFDEASARIETLKALQEGGGPAGNQEEPF